MGKWKRDLEAKDIPTIGSIQMRMDPKIEETSTDVYYKTEDRLPDSRVAIPTLDAVVEAKEWVDNENKK